MEECPVCGKQEFNPHSNCCKACGYDMYPDEPYEETGPYEMPEAWRD